MEVGADADDLAHIRDGRSEPAVGRGLRQRGEVESGQPFEIPSDIYASWDATASGSQRQAAWEDLFNAYSERYPAEAGEFERRMRGVLPADWERIAAAMVAEALAKGESVATRAASRQALNHLGPTLPELIGGSADLTGSNLTDW